MELSENMLQNLFHMLTPETEVDMELFHASFAPRQHSRVMSDKDTSAENLSVETKVAADEAAVKEETKKRAILGSTSSDANDDANERDDPAAAAAANHVVDVDDVEKGENVALVDFF